MSFLGWNSGSHRVRVVADNSRSSMMNRRFADGDGFASIMKSIGLTLKLLYSHGARKIIRRSCKNARVCVPPESTRDEELCRTEREENTRGPFEKKKKS